MNVKANVGYRFLNQINHNLIAFGVGIIAFMLYALLLSHTAFPGTSANVAAVCLGLEPQLAPSHPLLMSCVFPARFLPPGMAVLALNLWSALCGAASVALLFRYLRSWVQRRIVLDGGLPEYAPGAAGLTAGLVGAFAFATSLPLWAASTRLSMATFHALLLLLAFNLLQDNQIRDDRWRPFALALLCGVGCVESTLFLLMTPYFATMLLITLYQRKEATWPRITGLALAGLAGASLYLGAATHFVGSEGFSLAGYPGRLAIIERMMMMQLAELRQLFPRSGWIWVLIMVFLPWLATQFEAHNALNRRNTASSLVFHVVLIFLILPVQLNNSALPWVSDLPEGRLPVLEMLLVAMTLGYLASFWALCFMDAPGLLLDDDEERGLATRKKSEDPEKALRATAGVIVATLVLLLVYATAKNAGRANGRNGHFIDTYAQALLDQLSPQHWLITDGQIDTNLQLAAHARGQKLQLVNLSFERHPLHIRRLCQVIKTDPAFAKEQARYLNAARLGCAAFLQEWLSSDPEAAERLVFYGTPDLLFEAGLNAQTDQLVFVGVQDIESLKNRPLLEEHQPFWAKMQKILAGPVEGSSMAVRRGVLRRHLSMAANNLGVLLEDLGRPEEAISAYLQALEFDADNFSAMLNRVVLTRKGVTPADQEHAELAAAEALRMLKQRPVSSRLARFYGYVRVPGEFMRQSAEWQRFGQPRMAEASLKRAMALAPAEGQSQLLHELAALHLANNQPDKSEAAFRQILQDTPADPRALLGMLSICNMRQDYKAAREWLAKADKAGVLNKQINLELAKIEIAEGQYEQAQRRLLALTDADPAFLEAWALQVNVLIAGGKVDEAERDILPRMKKISRDAPQYLTAVTEAYILRSKGAEFFKAARESFILALRLQPGSRSVLAEILKLDHALRDQAAAVQHATILLRLERDNPLANYVMGTALIEQGDLAGAEEHLKRSAATSPSLPVFNDLAETLRMQNKLEEAELVIRRALALDPESPFALDTLACILIDAKRLPEAEKAAAAARAQAPDALPLKLTELRILAHNPDDLLEARDLARQISKHVDQLSPQQRAELAAAMTKLGGS
ncbi:MAG: tetratricopeptide repeat protein [Kiritimatiellae bacterium]|nr:tetratricopeptide repeat protein [Kiritimatiellia bacterium]